MNFKVFMIYLKAMGTIPPILVLCTAVLQMASDLGSNIWLSEWSRDTDIYVGNNTMPPGLPSLRVGVYGGLGGMSGTVINFMVLFSSRIYFILMYFPRSYWLAYALVIIVPKIS